MPTEPASGGEVEPVLLGGHRRYTRAEVAARADVPLEQAQRLWLALGFAEVGGEAAVFTDGDVEALRTVDELVRSDIIDPGTDRAVARQLGQTFSRLAEWQVQLITGLASSGTVAEEELPGRVAELLPVMERLQSYVWRRHLAAAAGRLLAGSAEEVDRTTCVVGFADVVGYTRMARGIDEAELGRFVERFEGTAADVVAARRGRIVKTVGDEVLFVIGDPVDAAEVALELTALADRDPDFPQLRVGMALGAVLHRFGDVYGSVVNVAARLTSVARRGSALVDETLATALRGEPAYRLRSARPVAVRGFAHLKVRRLSRAQRAKGDDRS